MAVTRRSASVLAVTAAVTSVALIVAACDGGGPGTGDPTSATHGGTTHAGETHGAATHGTSAPERNPAAFVEGDPYEPEIDAANFVDVIDNPFFPLTPGTMFVFEGEGERVEVTVTDETRVVMGVTTTVVRDQAFEDGELVEDSRDWFALDGDGNVWYFGEETAEIADGEIVNTHGSWEADVDGAQPGIVMLADPRVGDTYRQEFYEGEAEDIGRVHALDVSVEVPFGSFDGALETEDWTPLEPDIVEHKWYAPGIGVVREEIVEGGEGSLELVESLLIED